MKIRYLDLFSGAGGWSLGLNMAGLQHVALYDFDPVACETARRNLGGASICQDLRDFKSLKEHRGIEVVIGSPPCQGFSNEGYKNKSDPRNSLVFAFFDIIDLLKPKVWLFENVPGFRRLYGGEFYHLLERRLDRMDYHWAAFDLDACRYGVPQKRLRFFALGSKDFHPKPPEPTHTDSPSLFGGLPLRSLWEAISDLPIVGLGERKGVFPYLNPPENEYQKWCRKGSTEVNNHTTQNHSARVLEKIRAVPAGNGMEAFLDSYPENRVKYCGGYRRAKGDQPSYTAYWTRGMTSIHPEQDRFLSPRECARIQSFPDRFIFHGTTIPNYTLVCNAVPPLLAKSFGLYLRLEMRGERIAQTPL